MDSALFLVDDDMDKIINVVIVIIPCEFLVLETTEPIYQHVIIIAP